MDGADRDPVKSSSHSLIYVISENKDKKSHPVACVFRGPFSAYLNHQN